MGGGIRNQVVRGWTVPGTSGTARGRAAAAGLLLMTLALTLLVPMASPAPARAAAPHRSPGSVVAPPAAFHDDRCTPKGLTGAAFTIPTSVGVRYLVSGQVLSPGNYPADDGSTVTVVAHPAPGFQLTGITQWTHRFPSAPPCPARGTSTPATSSVSPPASGQATPSASPGSSAPGPTGSASPPPPRRHGVVPPTPAYTGVVVTPVVLIGAGLLLLGIACQLGAGEPRRARRAP